MIGSSKVAIGLYGITLVQWVMKRGRTVRGLIFDLIDATLFLSAALIAEAIWPQMSGWPVATLIAIGMLLGKFGARVTGMLWRRLDTADIEVKLPGGVVTIKSEPENLP